MFRGCFKLTTIRETQTGAHKMSQTKNLAQIERSFPVWILPAGHVRVRLRHEVAQSRERSARQQGSVLAICEKARKRCPQIASLNRSCVPDPLALLAAENWNPASSLTEQDHSKVTRNARCQGRDLVCGVSAVASDAIPGCAKEGESEPGEPEDSRQTSAWMVASVPFAKWSFSLSGRGSR